MGVFSSNVRVIMRCVYNGVITRVKFLGDEKEVEMSRTPCVSTDVALTRSLKYLNTIPR